MRSNFRRFQSCVAFAGLPSVRSDSAVDICRQTSLGTAKMVLALDFSKNKKKK